jgi:hypothetical protein
MFHQYPPDSVDTPPQLQGLYGLGVLPLAPFVIAGSTAAATATIGSWLGNNWDKGTYNTIAAKINDTIKQWDNQGWNVPGTGAKACWKMNPQRRKEFKAFWTRWSKHYGEYGKQNVYLSDSAEMPVRNIFLPELAQWAEWLNSACKIKTMGSVGPTPAPPDEGGPTTDMAAMVKWGVIGIGAIVLLNVVQGVRGAFPRRP